MRKATLHAVRSGTVLSFGLLALVCSSEPSNVAHAQSRLPTVDRFTATTVSMMPADIELRIDVREWSSADARSAVVAALAGGSDAGESDAAEPGAGESGESGASGSGAGGSGAGKSGAGGSGVANSLAELPTLGYVWRSDSGVGYGLKYAHRADAPQGERITFVTEKRLGEYDFEPWTVEGGSQGPMLDYSVIELYLPDNGSGYGTLSLAAKVALDRENGLVSLETPDGTPRLLANAQMEPKPYWSKTK